MNSLPTSWKLVITTLFFAVAAWSPKLVYAAPSSQPQQPADSTVRLMVKIDPNTYDAVSTAAFSAAVVDNAGLSEVGWQVIEVNAANVDAVKAQLQATQGVVEVTPDYPLELTWDPNDPSYTNGEQWALDKIGANIAWEFSAGQAITVAVVDSGIDPNHPDFVGRIVPGYNFIDKNDDPTDGCGHGTHVSGIIAADADNGIGVAGIASQAVIMPVKVIGNDCLGSYSRLMQGIIYAVDHGARIISITSGGGYEHQGLHDAIIYAHDHGVFVAVAAGNRGNDEPFYPGSFEESFTVAGTDENDQQYVNSNFGQQIDISAPATTIMSTYWDKEKGSSYAYMTGTSMAAPHVAAVAALVLAIDPKLTLTDLENTLINSVVDLGEPGWDPIFGWGRLTAWRAAAMVSPFDGNIRLGHYRVPEMSGFALTSLAITTDTDSIELSWAQPSADSDESVVIYRSQFPVFEAAEDIAEVPAAATATYTDTNVVLGQEYYYWLVEADNDVEMAITDGYNAKLATEPLTPEEPTEPTQPQEPQEPTQPADVAMFLPFLNK